MNDLKVNDKVIINDVVKNMTINNTSVNKGMLKYVGKEAVITQIFVNMYDKNDYYFLDIDKEGNVWQRQMLTVK